MWIKRILVLVLAVLLYLAGPLLAGMFAIGDRDGPIIYPEEYHTVMYIAAYEAVRNEKPRITSEVRGFERPLFYGFPQRRRSG